MKYVSKSQTKMTDLNGTKKKELKYRNHSRFMVWEVAFWCVWGVVCLLFPEHFLHLTIGFNYNLL